MTIIDALRNSVNYPLTTANVESITIKRGLDGENDLTTEIANSKEYQLAMADIYTFLVTSVNLSQGGASVQKTDVGPWVTAANAIYQRYGEPIIGTESKKPKFGYIGENF